MGLEASFEMQSTLRKCRALRSSVRDGISIYKRRKRKPAYKRQGVRYKRSGGRYKGKSPLQPGMAVADRKVKKSPCPVVVTEQREKVKSMNYGQAALSVASCSERTGCVRSASFMLSSIRCCKALHSCLSLANSSALLHLRAMIPCKSGYLALQLGYLLPLFLNHAGQLGEGGLRVSGGFHEAQRQCSRYAATVFQPAYTLDEERVAVECTAHVIFTVHRQVQSGIRAYRTDCAVAVSLGNAVQFPSGLFRRGL